MTFDIPAPEVEPGLYSDMTNDHYHAAIGLSSTTVKKYLEKAPARIQYEHDHKEQNVNDAYAVGSGLHAAMSGLFEQEIAVSPVWNLRTKDGRAARDRFMVDNQDKTVINEMQLEQVMGMARSIKDHPKASWLLDGAVYEQSVFWQDDTGEILKCRPDAIGPNTPLILDFKTTADASYSAVVSSVIKFGYHVSAAMYIHGVNQSEELLAMVGHGRIEGFALICVEKEPPYLTACYEIGPELLSLGHDLFLRGVENYTSAKHSGFPGYSPALRVLDAPPWANRIAVI